MRAGPQGDLPQLGPELGAQGPAGEAYGKGSHGFRGEVTLEQVPEAGAEAL